MTLNDLVTWHLQEAIRAGKRVLRATSDECRKANEASVTLHSDAVELLSDILDKREDYYHSREHAEDK